MKKIGVIIVFIMWGMLVKAQDFKTIATASFSTPESYVTAEPTVLECANFLFTTPEDKEDIRRKISMQYIMKWMEGCEYTFNVDSNIMELVDDRQELFALYMAGMSKIVLDNKGTILSDEMVYEKVVTLLWKYCEKKENNIKATKKMRKEMEK